MEMPFWLITRGIDMDKTLLEWFKTEEGKKIAFQITLDELSEIDLFRGIYDAKNGKDDFMYGISTVMECIAYKCSEEIGDAFSDMFMQNMATSEERANPNYRKEEI